MSESSFKLNHFLISFFEKQSSFFEKKLTFKSKKNDQLKKLNFYVVFLSGSNNILPQFNKIKFIGEQNLRILQITLISKY